MAFEKNLLREEIERSMHHRPTIQGRNIVINRRQAPDALSSSAMVRREQTGRYGYTGMLPQAYVSLSSKGVTAVKESREHEKKEMQDLNERLANYIEKVRFLEAQNRRLADELEKLKAKWGKETSHIRAMFQVEIAEAKRLLEETDREKAIIVTKLAGVDDVIDELRARLATALKESGEFKDRFEHQNQQLSDNEGELALLRRRLAALEHDRDKEKALIKKLQDGLNVARSDLDNESLLHIDAENQRQTLAEQLEFMAALHEQEIKELQALAYRDSTSENREYWKSEMGQALREIQTSYDDKLDTMKSELEAYYNLKIQEFRNGATRQNMETVHSKEETKRIRDQLSALRDKLAERETRIAQLMRELEQTKREKEEREKELDARNKILTEEVVKLRAEMEAMMAELQGLIEAKLGLEMEINAYRQMLEKEETRVGLHHSGSYRSSDVGLRHFVNDALDNRSSIDSGMSVRSISSSSSSATIRK